MNPIERFAREAFETAEPLVPLDPTSERGPVLATPALSYGALTTAMFMAGNVVTDFDGDESPTDGGIDDLKGRSGSDLLALRSARIARR